MGAAILDSTRTLYKGANVENAAYSGICAERVALTKCVTVSVTDRLRTASTRPLATDGDGNGAERMVGDGGGRRTLLAVGVAGDGDDYCTPCGVCRQFLREFSTDVPIYLFKSTGEHVVVGLDKLLPMSFGPDSLNIR